MTKEIQLTIDGEHVTPATVALTDLLDLLAKFNAALLATAKHAGMNPKDMQVSLTVIESGSNVLTLATDDRTNEHAQLIIDAIRDSDVTTLPAAARQPILDLWDKACSRKWEIRVARSDGARACGTIRPDSPLYEQADARGATSIVAHILRVGGEDRPTANFRLPDGQQLTSRVVSRELAERLGHLLFKHVELKGDAVWSLPGWNLTSFVITDVGDYTEETSDPVNALNELAEASNGAWDTIDPTEYVAKQRAD
jgi:hypothetical protein